MNSDSDKNSKPSPSIAYELGKVLGKVGMAKKSTIADFKCPRCQESLQTSLDDIGESVDCPTCNLEFTVPPSLPKHNINWKMLSCGAAGIFILLITLVLYFSSDHHSFRVAAKLSTQGDYVGALELLDSLPAKYNDPLSRGGALRNSVNHKLAAKAYIQGSYEDALRILESIPATYIDYEMLQRDKAKAEQKVEELRIRRENANILKEIAAQQKAQDEAREKEEALLYGANLDAKVNFSNGQVHITNKNSYNWSGVELRINSGVFNKGYFTRARIMEAGESYTVGIMQFANKKGERFNPYSMKAQTITIIAEKPNGSSAIESYNWN